MPIINDPPPIRGTAGRPAAARAPKQSMRQQREEAVAGFGQLAQAPLIALHQYADAGAIGLHWPNVAREVASLADSQEQVARLIDPLIKIGPYTGLITAILPLILQIGVNHNRVPAGAMGTVPAASLSAQVETAMAAIELQALQQQAEAEMQAQQLRDQIAKSRNKMTESAQAA